MQAIYFVSVIFSEWDGCRSVCKKERHRLHATLHPWPWRRKWQSITEYFIIVDTTTIPGGNTAVEAFDRLFKVHYIFNVNFARPVMSFFNFLEGLYELHKNIKPTVRELYSQMLHSKLTAED